VLAERASRCWAALGRSPLATHGAVRSLLELARRPLPREVSRTALRALHPNRFARLEDLATRASHDLLDEEATLVHALLGALDTCDLHAPLVTAEADAVPFQTMMEACCVAGQDGDVGIGSVDALPFEHTDFIVGPRLFDAPRVEEGDEPSAELFARTLARLGHYDAAGANELLAEDERELVGSWYSGPFRDTGAALLAALPAIDAALAAAASEPDEGGDEAPLLGRLHDYRRAVLDAAEHGHSVIEWLVKY
jgi:hypothetical protein